MAKKAARIAGENPVPSSPPHSVQKSERRSRKGPSSPDASPRLLDGPASVSPEVPAAAVYEVRAAFSSLRASPLNYRETYDPLKLQELKDEIRLQGLAHNLVARPLEGSLFEVVIGGRRMRALGELVDEGAWDPDAENVPLQVRPGMTDLEAIVLAMGENNKRQGVHYLEEAEGIRRAIDLMTNGKRASRNARTTARLAEQLGLGQRWVQILNGLARRLHPEVKDFIRERNLSLDCAKAFAVVPAERQAEVLPELRDEHCLDSDSIRVWMTDSLPPVDAALFDLASYKGPITQVGVFVEPVLKDKTSVPLPEGAEEPIDEEVVSEHFVDLEQYGRLQRAAVEKMRVELVAVYAFVEVLEGTRLPLNLFNHHLGAKDPDTGIVLLIAPDLSVRRIECKRHQPAPEKLPSVATFPRSATSTLSTAPTTLPPASAQDVAPTTAQDSSAALPPDPPFDNVLTSADSPFSNPGEVDPSQELEEAEEVSGTGLLTKSHVYRVHREKTKALQTALARSPADAMRVAVVGLLGFSSFFRIQLQHLSVEADWALAPELMPQLESLKRALGELLPEPFFNAPAEFNPNDLKVLSTSIWDEHTPAKLLGVLAALPDSTIAELFAFLVAVRSGSFCDYSPKYGDDPGAFRLAELLGIERAPASVDDAFLQGYRKPHLLAVARQCGVDDPRLDRRTMTEIRQALLAAPDLASFQPPELTFGDTRDVERSLHALSRQDPPIIDDEK